MFSKLFGPYFVVANSLHTTSAVNVSHQRASEREREGEGSVRVKFSTMQNTFGDNCRKFVPMYTCTFLIISESTSSSKSLPSLTIYTICVAYYMLVSYNIFVNFYIFCLLYNS